MAGKEKVKYSNTNIATEQMRPTVCPERRWQIQLAAVIIIATGIAVFLNSFDGVFLYDDTKSIVKNPHIRKLWPLSESMSVPLANSGATVSGRPILSLSFAINYALFGKEPWGYHLVNLVIHICAGLLLFGIVRRTLSLEQFRDRYRKQAICPALAVALLWVVHPLQTESVTYIVQRAESMMGMFFLLTLYCAVRGFQSKRAYLWYIVSVFVCALGMGTKEVMVAAPMIILLYDYVFICGSFKASLQRHWGLYVTLAATWIISVTQILMTRKMIIADLQIIGPLKYALTQPGVILHYLRLSIWPSPLVTNYNWPLAEATREIMLPSLVILSMLVLTGWGLFRKRWFGFVGAWFFFILAPSSSFIPTLQNAFEHRMYLPLASVILPAVVGGEYILFKPAAGRLSRRIRQIVAAGAVLSIVVTLGYLCYERNKDYHSGFVFWADNVTKRPESEVAHIMFGGELMKQGNLEAAKAQYEYVLRLNPSNADAHSNLGVIFMKEGDLGLSKSKLEEALRISPNHADAHYNFGNLLMQQGDLAEAKIHYEDALAINPNHSDVHNNLGTILMGEGNLSGAKVQYEYALRIKPNYAEAHYNLGNILMQEGKPAEARARYEQVLVINPAYADAHNNLGVIFLRQGDIQQARAKFDDTLRIEPKHYDAHHNIGDVFASQQDFMKAKFYYERAFEINSNNLMLMNKLAWLLATCPDDTVRDGVRAVELAQKACNITSYKEPGLLNTLAAAYAEADKYTEAVETANKALNLAKYQNNEPVYIEQIQLHLEQYKQGKPFRNKP